MSVPDCAAPRFFRAFEVTRKTDLPFYAHSVDAHQSRMYGRTRWIMEPIPTPSEISALLELIRIFMRENYQALEPSKLKEEAEYLVNQLRKQAAGRVYEMMHLDGYYKERQALKPKIEDSFSACRPLKRLYI